MFDVDVVELRYTFTGTVSLYNRGKNLILPGLGSTVYMANIWLRYLLGVILKIPEGHPSYFALIYFLELEPAYIRLFSVQ